MRTVLPAALGLLALAASSLLLASEQELFVGYHHEAGVESKLLGTLLADFSLHPRIDLDAGVAFSAVEHPGLARLGLGMTVRLTDLWHTRTRVGLQHEQWNDWRIGENRALVMFDAEPLRGLELGAGIAWRAPVYSVVRYWLPHWFASDAAELNLLYHAGWRFLRRDRVTATFIVSNLDRLVVRNPQQFPFRLEASTRLAPGWRLDACCGSAVTGLSSMLVSLKEVTVELGIRHEL